MKRVPVPPARLLTMRRQQHKQMNVRSKATARCREESSELTYMLRLDRDTTPRKPAEHEVGRIQN